MPTRKERDIDRACKEIADKMLAEIQSHRFSVDHAVKALKEANIDPDTRCIIIGDDIAPEFVRAVTEAKSRGIVVVDIQRDFLDTGKLSLPDEEG